MYSNPRISDSGKIFSLLEDAYGVPQCKANLLPLDELILTILSQSTSSANYSRAFEGIKRQFPSWEDVSRADATDIEDSIRAGGLARTKAVRIKAILEEIYARQGSLDLGFIADMTDDEALEYLMGFHGVGIKTAACVLMFSLCRDVLPVDTHVHRISQRLGLIGPRDSAEGAYHLLRDIVPAGRRYSAHVNMVTHGRRICKAVNPSCDICGLLPECPYGMKHLGYGGI